MRKDFIMKHMHRHFLFFGLVAWYIVRASILFGQNTYHGNLITPETLSLCIQPLPPDAKVVIDWIEAHAADMRYLAALPTPLSSWADKKVEGKSILADLGIKNQGNNNFVFKVPNSNWWIKIGGPLRRIVNIYVFNTGKNPFIPREYERHQEFGNATLLNTFKRVSTYQTISRFANFLRCQDVIQRHAFEHVYVPEIYLVHIPGTPDTICDDNYLIVERAITNTTNICGNVKEKSAFTNTVLLELYTLITEAGIFDFNGENLHIDAQGKFIFLDLEQGIVENPADFYNKNKESFDFYVFFGIREFVKTHLTKNTPAYNFFKSLVRQDDSLIQSAYWPRYQKLFGFPREKTRSKKEYKLTSFAVSQLLYPATSATLQMIST